MDFAYSTRETYNNTLHLFSGYINQLISEADFDNAHISFNALIFFRLQSPLDRFNQGRVYKQNGAKELHNYILNRWKGLIVTGVDYKNKIYLWYLLPFAVKGDLATFPLDLKRYVNTGTSSDEYPYQQF
jgi:hypothetical protein